MASTIAPDQGPHEGDVLRVWGPPGTGKTRYLSERVRSTVKEHGPDSVMIASFSTTAAKEIGGRFATDGAGRPPDSAIGTLHSHAFRALGNPNVALDSKVLSDWNENNPPELHITPSVRGGGNSGDSGALGVDPAMARTGDELIGALDKLRAAQVEPDDWPVNVREFAERWTDWKREVAACDFTDMIEGALGMAQDGTPAPGRPDFLIIDEAQDMTPLEVSLALSWGSQARRLVLGMDDDQAINRWRGGDPEPLLNLYGEGIQDKVLDRSYRVPEAVRAVAEQWVRRLSLRREKIYHSRLSESGDVVPGIAHRVERKIRDAELITDLIRETEAGRTVMVIASCNYLLDELIGNLRAEGVPFHNPYRPAEQRWNPLGAPARDGTVSTVERVRAFLSLTERDWTGADVQAWLELVKLSSAGMVRGAKTAASRFESNAVVPFEDIAALFKDEEMLSLATEPSIDFLERNLLSAKADVARYPLQVARAHGAQALDVTPMITVGTIHCSPPDEPVLTSKGYVPIGELTPGVHRLVSYDTSGGLVRGERGDSGRNFMRAVNPYSGPLITMETERSKTRITPDHRVRMAFDDSFFEKWIVYLMVKHTSSGSWWRVGHCVSGHRPYRSGGLGGRLATEQADGGWILGVYESKREAVIAEATIQGRFGIPGTTFEAALAREVTSADLHSIHQAAMHDVAPRAKELLVSYGLVEECPLLTRTNRKLNRSDQRATFLTEARNLVHLNGYIKIPVLPVDFGLPGRQSPDVIPARISVNHYEGEVHSLEVLPHHHYVSGGAIVHNSVKGAAADVVYVCPDVSGAARKSMSTREGVDDAIRLFYVGMTRAYEELRVLAPATNRHMVIAEMIPPELEVFA